MRIRFFRIVIIVLTIVMACVFYLLYNGNSQRYLQKTVSFLTREKPETTSKVGRSPLENNILDHLKTLETPDSLVTFRTLPEDSGVMMSAPVARGKPIEWTIWYLSTAIIGTTYRVDDCLCPSNDRGCTIHFVANEVGGQKKPPVTLSIQWAARYNSKSSKMAILIKDFGFVADKTTIDYLSFPEPLTVSLVPSKKLASWTAQISNEYKKEIVVLLPMEPISSKKDISHSSIIMVHYPEEKLRTIILSAEALVPGFAGFCNLSGARVLEDSRVMGVVFSELKKKRSYFVEEGVTRKTIAPVVAAQFAVPFGTVDVSIDSTLSVKQIQELLRRSAVESGKRGNVIICSRATRQFFKALTAELPMLRQNGIRLSYISEIVDPENTAKK